MLKRILAMFFLLSLSACATTPLKPVSYIGNQPIYPMAVEGINRLWAAFVEVFQLIFGQEAECDVVNGPEDPALGADNDGTGVIPPLFCRSCPRVFWCGE